MQRCLLAAACLILLVASALAEESDGYGDHHYGGKHHGGKHGRYHDGQHGNQDDTCSALTDKATCTATAGCAYKVKHGKSYCYNDECAALSSDEAKCTAIKGCAFVAKDDKSFCYKDKMKKRPKKSERGRGGWSVKCVLMFVIPGVCVLLGVLGLYYCSRRRASTVQVPVVQDGSLASNGLVPGVVIEEGKVHAWQTAAELGMVTDTKLADPGARSLQVVADADSRPSSAGPTAL